jgi:hypothetical protein
MHIMRYTLYIMVGCPAGSWSGHGIVPGEQKKIEYFTDSKVAQVEPFRITSGGCWDF